MTGLNFNQLKQLKVRDLQQFETDFSKLPETSFKLTYKEPEINYAEEFVEGLE